MCCKLKLDCSYCTIPNCPSTWLKITWNNYFKIKMLPFFENCIKIKRVHVFNAVSMISQKLSLFFFHRAFHLHRCHCDCTCKMLRLQMFMSKSKWLVTIRSQIECQFLSVNFVWFCFHRKINHVAYKNVEIGEYYDRSVCLSYSSAVSLLKSAN